MQCSGIAEPQTLLQVLMFSHVAKSNNYVRQLRNKCYVLTWCLDAGMYERHERSSVLRTRTSQYEYVMMLLYH
jgi:hypothetical protein